MQNISSFNSDIPLGIAIGRRNRNQCINCGKPEEHVELNSCSAPHCVKIMRKVKQWSKEVGGHFTKVWAPIQHGGNW
jgi:hypothetical protein